MPPINTALPTHMSLVQLHHTSYHTLTSPISLSHTATPFPFLSICTVNMTEHATDVESHPATFQKTWTANPDPTALPFERDNPPFQLTPVDWYQLSITDDQFTPHTWENVAHLISIGELDELKRWPSFLK